jgi:hypothetical protein
MTGDAVSEGTIDSGKREKIRITEAQDIVRRWAQCGKDLVPSVVDVVEKISAAVAKERENEYPLSEAQKLHLFLILCRVAAPRRNGDGEGLSC